MKKILIANRGEIANRIIKSCKILGHKSVAVYSDADKNSKHVRLSDESYYIGPSKAQESYLSYNKILEIATKSGFTISVEAYLLSKNNCCHCLTIPKKLLFKITILTAASL